MRVLKIHCQNCKGTGRIIHPTLMSCPFCDGEGNKDITYMEDVKSTLCEREKEIKINGIKTTIIIPKGMKPEDVPREINSVEDRKSEPTELECAKCSNLLVTIKGDCEIENEEIYCGKCDDLITEARVKTELEKQYPKFTIQDKGVEK